jgi:hypothetical protein
MVLLIGFFIFYQSNPMYAIIMIVIFVGVFLFYKSRSGNSGSGVLSFLSGNGTQQDNNMDDLITLMMIQQLLNSPSSSRGSEGYGNDNGEREREKEIDKIKNEVLELLEED